MLWCALLVSRNGLSENEGITYGYVKSSCLKKTEAKNFLHFDALCWWVSEHVPSSTERRQLSGNRSAPDMTQNCPNGQAFHLLVKGANLNWHQIEHKTLLQSDITQKSPSFKRVNWNPKCLTPTNEKQWMGDLRHVNTMEIKIGMLIKELFTPSWSAWMYQANPLWDFHSLASV